MKDIRLYINEASAYFKWNCKEISQNDFIKIAKEVLKKIKATPQKIQDELSQYEDPDDLWDAYERGDLTYYSEFEEEMANTLANDDKYGGKEGDIMDYFSSEAYDILDLI